MDVTTLVVSTAAVLALPILAIFLCCKCPLLFPRAQCELFKSCFSSFREVLLTSLVTISLPYPSPRCHLLNSVPHAVSLRLLSVINVFFHRSHNTGVAAGT